MIRRNCRQVRAGGLFKDLLHELIKLQVPCAGPIIGTLQTSELMYADDVGLLSWNHADAQRLLGCLSLFCTLFDMEVHLAKTQVIVFQRPSTACPTAALINWGAQLELVDSCRYLGLQIHATKGFDVAIPILPPPPAPPSPFSSPGIG